MICIYRIWIGSIWGQKIMNKLIIPELKIGTEKLKKGFAKMQKGGVIMDVTNAQQACIAEGAGADSLYLIHYPNGRFKDNDIVAKASQEFNGPVRLAEDFMEFEF